jgi:Sec-independent protein translocase protein TatA
MQEYKQRVKLPEMARLLSRCVKQFRVDTVRNLTEGGIKSNRLNHAEFGQKLRNVSSKLNLENENEEHYKKLLGLL